MYHTYYHSTHLTDTDPIQHTLQKHGITQIYVTPAKHNAYTYHMQTPTTHITLKHIPYMQPHSHMQIPHTAPAVSLSTDYRTQTHSRPALCSWCSVRTWHHAARAFQNILERSQLVSGGSTGSIFSQMKREGWLHEKKGQTLASQGLDQQVNGRQAQVATRGPHPEEQGLSTTTMRMWSWLPLTYQGPLSGSWLP